MIAVDRKTRETTVNVRVQRGTGVAKIATTIPFLDHMLVTLARYSALDIDVRATGDLRHHVIEDVAITLGGAVKQLVTPNVLRYGERTVPMDDALVQGVIDVGGRPYYSGALPSTMYGHWMRSFAFNTMATLHVRVLRGRDKHHVVEAAFKALGFALGQALTEGSSVLSTKGSIGAS
jgi:imidazoleglycerol-phosphate dehydratase